MQIIIVTQTWYVRKAILLGATVMTMFLVIPKRNFKNKGCAKLCGANKVL